MAIFKCKMCGGTIEFEQGATIGVCDSCGTRQTLPRLDDDRRVNLYDRANHFRRNNDFDKAAGIYEHILNEDTSDAEAYWSLVLCRYGIEYVEDPATRKRVPTVNRAQFTSIFDDDNYKSAIHYADGYQRTIYEEEAAAINEIQKGILAISQKEEPFDIFICYKETDANGRRTQDSVLANDLYHQLTQEGFKVFFSRITLEDKLGTAYEPYIFAALNSAKVMVVLGTRPEHFNAVWVKNEWSRYLSLVKQSGGKKVLIPAYRDMDPYDLPEEFSHLQAQDMSKLGFMQDLIRGIKKIMSEEKTKAAAHDSSALGGMAQTSVAPLLKRAFMFLEDEDWKSADEYCEKVLDQDPENAQAYLGKLMAELHVRRQEDLPDCDQPFDRSNNYQKAVRFGDKKLAESLKGYVSHICERNENTRLTGIYNNAVSMMNSAESEAAYKEAAAVFNTIPEFKDADYLAEQCLDQAEVCRKDAIYGAAHSQMAFAGKQSSIKGYETAIQMFQKISDWKDAEEQIFVCQRKIEEIKKREEDEKLERQRREKEAAKKRKRKIAIVTPIILLCIGFIVLLTTVILPKQKLNKAMSLIDSGDYEAAYKLLEELGDNNAIASSKYDRAVALINSGDFEAAIILLDGLNYKDSAEMLDSALLMRERILLSEAQVGSYVLFGYYEQDNNIANGKENIEWLVLEREGDKVLLISRYALDCQQYNSSSANVTWETCSLRSWLNGAFLNDAFSAVEQSMIQNTTVKADKNPRYSTSSGNNTTDKAFLLGASEAESYYGLNSERQCEATAYCKAHGGYSNSSGAWWWLRSLGYDHKHAVCVRTDGSVYTTGYPVSIEYIAVRPALWINLAP